MRTLGLLCCALVLVACEKPKEQPAADTTAAMASSAGPRSRADLARRRRREVDHADDGRELR